jgi:hypothetical protein
MIRRPVKSTWSGIRDMLCASDTVTMVMFMAIGLLALVPQSFFVVIPLTMFYYGWVCTRKFRLPFKAPMTWGGIDYNAPKPGGAGFSTAGGILYLGQDQTSKEELWMENGDARRHGFFLGTTGSGKALPMDALVLTPRGWVFNGGILPGEELIHPLGGTAKVLSIHPQGVIPAVRLRFSDGRHADCSMDHLWHVKMTPRGTDPVPCECPEEGKLMTAADLGIMIGLYGDRTLVKVPLSRAADGTPVTGTQLSEADAQKAATDGLRSLDYMPSITGTPSERRYFLTCYMSFVQCRVEMDIHGVRACKLRADDARALKQLIWSLGGLATTYVSDNAPMGRLDLWMMFDGIADVWPQASVCALPDGLEIIGVDRLEADLEMSCIKTDREDGLYVMEGHVVTHNTELLLGIVSQTLMWSSGFMFIDGKGTTEFYARAWTLAKRFGREDDLRVLNFTDPGGDPDAPAGGPYTQSNTVNPFAKGSADQLMNIVVSLMGDAGAGNDMWKNRAMSLVTAEMKALCELRDSGDILLNVQTIRDFLFIGKGFDKALLRGRKMAKLEDVPEEAWDELKTRAGLIELYLRAMRGEFSNATLLAMKGFFDTLPGFIIEKALNGDNQDGKCLEQYGFLSMQLTKPLGSLADDYGHIFRTPLGEVDIDDVVLNRRILIVLLPALQKAEEEMKNCGKIIVTMTKIMMGNASGSMIQGSKQEIVDAKQTRAPSPFVVVLDEAGYYMVAGIDVMMAQARSLGFMVIVAGQDMAAMQKVSPQIAETAAANASILAAGKTVDGEKTVKFIQSVFGRVQVAVTSGFQNQPGVFGNKWVDRMDATFQEVDRVKASELQNMNEGEFYFLFNGTLVRASTFYIGGNFADQFSINKFIKVRGPTDRVPGLDQQVETDFLEAYVKSSEAMMDMAGILAKNPELAIIDPSVVDRDEEYNDAVDLAMSISSQMLWDAGKKGHSAAQIMKAWCVGVTAAELSTMAGHDADDTEDGDDDNEDHDGEGDDMAVRIMADIDDIDSMMDGMFDKSDEDAKPKAKISRQRPKVSPLISHLLPQQEPAEDRSLGDSIKAMSDKETSTRHRGLVDMLIAQQNARLSAINHSENLAKEIVASEQEVHEVDRTKPGKKQIMDRETALNSMFEEFGMTSDQASETVKGAQKIRPVTLERMASPEDLTDSLANIEGFLEESDE